MKKKTLSMIIVSGLLTGMLAFSVYASYDGSASAWSTGAEASVTASDPGSINVYATIGNALGWARDEVDESSSTYEKAQISDSELDLTNGGPATSSRARGWYNGHSAAEDYWTD